MSRFIRACILGPILAGVLAFGAGWFIHANADTTAPTPPRFTRVACEQEDSIGCYWNAGEAGNGVGHSFYSIRFGRTGGHCLAQVLVRYWDRDYGRTHDHIDIQRIPGCRT